VFSRTEHSSSGSIALQCIAEFHDAKQWISDVKFSPDGASLAVGAHDNGIYLYSIISNSTAAGSTEPVQFQKRAKFAKHNSYITHFDFTADSQRLRSNCGAYELLFSDANTGAQIGSASSLKDAQWSSSTCTLGWAVQGIWPPCADGTDIVGFTLSQLTSSCAAMLAVCTTSKTATAAALDVVVVHMYE
jgi:WD40 repeat protein